jgi:RNA polymerase sigma factor (sigma-70 family)
MLADEEHTMPPTSVQQVYRHLRQLTARPGDSRPDTELLRQFVAAGDDSSFTVLVQRHAGMVLAVCRSILHNAHDAEDVFQAAFLVLARKAATIRKGQSVGSWLYAVAVRLAWKARARSDRRHTQPLPKGLASAATPMDDLTWGELRGILHEEVSRLPEKYRAAVVLCYWQGQTHEQASQQLGCARGTVKDRLERARERLRTRLARRGLALSAAWFAAALSGSTSSAAVSSQLLQTTVQGAILFARERLPAGIVSAGAVDSARGALQAMLLNKLKLALVLTLSTGLLGMGAALTALPTPTAGGQENRREPGDAQPSRSKVAPVAEPLPPGAVARLGTLRFRHGDRIRGLALGGDGKSVVTTCGKFVHVWELATGKELFRLGGFSAPANCVAASRDGKLIAAGCEDGAVRLFDVAERRELRRIVAHKERAPGWVGRGGVARLLFTSDGRRLVSMGSDTAVRLWDSATGEQLHDFGRFKAVWGLALAPDGQTLAGVVNESDSWSIRLWEVADGHERKRLTPPDTRPISVAFSPDGKMLATGVGEGDWRKPSDIVLWDVARGEEIRRLRGHKGWVGCLAFAPDSKTLVSTSSVDISARVWDVKTGAELRHLGPDRRAPIFQLLFGPDGKTLVSYGQEHTLRQWNAATGEEVSPSEEAQSAIGTVGFSPDGRLLAGSCQDGTIRLWDAITRKEARRFQHGASPVAVLFSPRGNELASACLLDPEVRIWDIASGEERRRIPANKGGGFLITMAWSGDGQLMATWNIQDRLVHLWDPATGRHLREWSPGDASINSLVFSPDSKILAAACGLFGRGNRLLLWATDSGRLLHSLEAPGDLHDFHRVVFAPDGRSLAAGGRYAGPSSLYLWEVMTGRQRLTLKHGEDITSLVFSPDGQVLAAADNKTGTHISANGSSGIQEEGEPTPPRVRLWDVAAEEELPPLEGHQGAITALSFSPDGKLLASASNDTTVLLWDTTRWRKARPRAAGPLGRERIEALWADLGSDDAARAYRALRTLAASPRESVEFLKHRLRPVAPADDKQVARLLADLDGDDFAAREKAMRELERLGESAATELHKALTSNPSLEIKRRIEQLLEKAPGPEQVRQVRAVEALERMGTPEARALCQALADGTTEARLTREARATLRRLRQGTLR